jgi:hypothetical protein
MTQRMVLSVRRPLRQNISVEQMSHASSVHGTFMAEVGGSRRWWKEKSERRGSAVLVWSVPPSPVQLQCPTCDDEQRCLPTSRTRCPCTGVIATSGARRSGRLACDRAPFTQSCSCLPRGSHHGRMHLLDYLRVTRSCLLASFLAGEDHDGAFPRLCCLS